MKRRDFLKVATAGAGAAAAAISGESHALMREPLQMPPKAVGMLYDSTLCIGCKACMVACKQANDVPVEHAAMDDLMYDTPLDLSGSTFNVIKAYRDGNMEQKDREINGYAFMKRHCLHCVDPSCISACPVSAMEKDSETGIVRHYPDRCIGCRYCVAGCPFGVPKYQYNDAFGEIAKCQFCSHLQAKGQIPGITQQGHLKDGHSMDKGNAVFPLGQAVKIPHLPKKSAYQRCHSRTHHHLPVPFRDSRQDMFLSHEGLKGQQDQQG